MIRALTRTILSVALVTSFTGCPVSAKATATTNIAQASNPRLASDSSANLHAVFEGFDGESSVRDILYSASSDKGSTWSQPINISKTPGVSTAPAIAVESTGAVDVVWRDTTSGELRPDIYFTRSSDGGKTWSPALDISNTPGVCSEPVIAVGPDNAIHTAWVDTSLNNGRPDIFYSVSTDGGKSWSKYEDISPTPGISREPILAVAGDGVVHAGWIDTSSGEEHPDVYYTRKVNGEWTKPIDVSNSPKISAHPSIACSAKGRVFLCWVDNSQKTSAADIWCAIGRNGKFDKPINISDTPGVSSQPTVVTDRSGRVAVVWTDTTSGVANPHIYARISTDSGDDFSNVVDITKAAGSSKKPSAAFAGTKLFVTWEELAGTLSNVKSTSIEVKGIATGPVDQVNPTVHRVNR